MTDTLDAIAREIYTKREGSNSGHCCFDWTVMGPHGSALAECFDESDADLILAALRDAARYRFLRDNAGIGFQVTLEMRREASEWDSQIDAARGER